MSRKYSVIFLKRYEYSKGNGQCPECDGLQPFAWWDYTKKSHGHKKGCLLAKSLEELNQKVIYSQENRWSRKFLNSEIGKYLHAKRILMQNEIDEILIRILTNAGR